MCALSVRAAMREGEKALKEAGIDDAQGNVRRLIEGTAKQPMWRLIVDDYELTDQEEEDLFKAIEERKSGKPLQYILKKAPFMELELSVDENVLIPRFDTESVAAKAIELAQGFKEPLVLDIGTGSGAIAISVAYDVRSSRVVATDISPEALDIAALNAGIHGVEDRITFMESDLYQGLPESYKGSFDVIVCNPPYIAVSEFSGLDREVKDHEPRAALSAGDDPLNVYRMIAAGAGDYIKSGGFIVLEIGDGMAGQVGELVKETGLFTDLCISPDISGIERVLSARHI